MKLFKFFVDIEKEEKWLNQMAKEGWELYGKAFAYQFRKMDPNEPIIRIDYRSFKSKADFEDYCLLFKDSGWEHIAGSKWYGVQYFKRIIKSVGKGELLIHQVNTPEDNDIFSDLPSKAIRYRKVSSMWLIIAISYILILLVLSATKAINLATLTNPKLLYLTPGLWESTGDSFWKAFLFETPFAIMRGFFWVIFLALIILYIIFAIKSEKNYRKRLHS